MQQVELICNKPPGPGIYWFGRNAPPKDITGSLSDGIFRKWDGEWFQGRWHLKDAISVDSKPFQDYVSKAIKNGNKVFFVCNVDGSSDFDNIIPSLTQLDLF